ncbi:MAG TPA: hypothetical protein VKU89_03090 [Solirubrobacteraceae bacterium]|nr:hypothetical protein [Solirubrobacteraceae bacterium]
MLTVRAGAVAAPLPDGKIRIVGGETKTKKSQTSTKSAEVYNRSTKSFEAHSAQATASRDYAAGAVLPSGEALIVAGYDTESKQQLKSAEA